MSEKGLLSSGDVGFGASAPADAPPPYSPYPSLPADPNAQIGFNVPQQQPTPVVKQPQPQLQPQLQPQTVVQVVQAPPTLTALGPESVRITCHHCRADISTRVDKDPSIAAYVSAGIIFILGCVCGCCLIPFCMDSCKTSEHYCPNCKKFIGRYSRY